MAAAPRCSALTPHAGPVDVVREVFARHVLQKIGQLFRRPLLKALDVAGALLGAQTAGAGLIDACWVVLP